MIEIDGIFIGHADEGRTAMYDRGCRMIGHSSASVESGDGDGLILYLHYGSVCCSKVQLVLEEKGLEAEHRIVNHRAGEAQRPEYLLLNPRGVVPTLVDDGRPIRESTVICEYLEDRFPDILLRPNDVYDRALMRLWTLRPDAGLHSACAKITFALRQGIDFSLQMTASRPKTSVQLSDVIELGLDAPGLSSHLGLYDQTLEEMARQLEFGDWLLGDHFSLADIAMLPYLMRLESLGLDWLWNDHVDRQRVAGWLAAWKRRPSFRSVFGITSAEERTSELSGDHAREKVLGLLKEYYA